ncbi:MAG: hypothetical protein WBQ03_20610 [Candidatus Sulfotelmatobacter sp.]
MRTIREILLTEYIGAILVAVLIADAFSALISVAVAQISYHARFPGHVAIESVWLSTTYLLLSALIRIVLFLTSAYLIARWLYPPNTVRSRSNTQNGI